MRRFVPWVVAIVVISSVVVWKLQAEEPSAPAPAAGTDAAEKIAFTFTDDAQMEQFARLWRGRQDTLTRMAVLKSYWDQEDAGLAKANQDLLAQFNLDVTKNYTLDTQRKVLVEREASAPTPQIGQTPADASSSVSSTAP